MIDVVNAANGFTAYPVLEGRHAGQWSVLDGGTLVALASDQMQAGQVLRLMEPTAGIEPGWFVLLNWRDDELRVCRLGENDNGDICETDEVYSLPPDEARHFTPTAIRIGGE